MFMNCGGSEIEGTGPSEKFSEDSCLEGGNVIETGEPIAGSGSYTALYQSAQYGAFSYKIDGITPGQYFVDLHFAEIVNTCGPKGMRTFDIIVKEEKIVSGLDIYKIVGANRALQIVDIRASVVLNKALAINFQSLTGSPIICGIAVRKASALLQLGTENQTLATTVRRRGRKRAAESARSSSPLTRQSARRMAESRRAAATKMGDLISNKGSSKMDTSAAQNKARGTIIASETRKRKMELDSKNLKNGTLEQIVERLTGELSELSKKYQHDKKRWAEALSDLERKIKIMKEEQAKLLKEAHACADSISDLDKMTEAV